MISGIHNWRIAVAAASLLTVGGCGIAKPQAPDRVNPTPIVIDEAMRLRQWPQSAAVYPNFSVTAGPTEIIWSAWHSIDPKLQAGLETPVFVIDTLEMPILMAIMPPFSHYEASSLYLPPTYTGGPPVTPPPGRPNDLSGGTGVAYDPTPDRTQHYLPIEPGAEVPTSH